MLTQDPFDSDKMNYSDETNHFWIRPKEVQKLLRYRGQLEIPNQSLLIDRMVLWSGFSYKYNGFNFGDYCYGSNLDNRFWKHAELLGKLCNVWKDEEYDELFI